MQMNFEKKASCGPVATSGQAEKGEATKQQQNFHGHGTRPGGGANGDKRQVNFKYGGK